MSKRSERIARIENAKERYESSKTEEAKIAGALEQLYVGLQERFGCQTLKEAQTLLDKKSVKVSELEEALDELLDQFEKDFPDEDFEED